MVMNSPEIAVFLGAGASCAEGAPSQQQLLREYFNCWRLPDNPLTTDGTDGSHQLALKNSVARFLASFFGIDVHSGNLTEIAFPTFEEALSTIELAQAREESFVPIGIPRSRDPQSPLRALRRDLILLIASIFDVTLSSPGIHHRNLVQALAASGKLSKCVFVSLNYDILIDNALIALHPAHDIDYGIGFTNFDLDDEWKRPRPDSALELIKLHGSLNWLYCPACRSITVTPKEKSVCRLVTKPVRCPKCRASVIPIIIPPSYFKVLSNLQLQVIWHRAEQALSHCSKWVFCGYSFPDADIHVKYLLKRVQVNSPRYLRIRVANWHNEKVPELAKQEEQRFHRFFGVKSDVRYTMKSFEDFCADPLSLLGD